MFDIFRKNVRTVRRTAVILCIISVVFGFVGMATLDDPSLNKVVLLIAGVCFAAAILITALFYKCPHCGKPIPSHSGDICTHCGKYFDAVPDNVRAQNKETDTKE